MRERYGDVFKLGVDGESLLVSALLVHHRAGIYPEPEEFRPDGFLGREPALLDRAEPRRADPEPRQCTGAG